MAFVVLVAVGADYNMLFVSRMRDESPHGMRYGVIRTLSSTGGVITAAGLIFAASMGGLLFSSISTVVQGGFMIGVGILLDTFVVRTITVPAMATLVGRANWWPSRAEIAAVAGRAGGVRSGLVAEAQAGVGMKRLLAAASALVTVGATGCFGFGIAAADDAPADNPPAPGNTAAGHPGKGVRVGGRARSGHSL